MPDQVSATDAESLDETGVGNAEVTTPSPEKVTDASKTFDAEYVAKLRQENASYRTKYKEAATERDTLKSKVDEHEAANLSELDRLEKERNEYAEKVQKLSEISSQRILDYEAVVLANKLNIVDPDAAVKLLDRSELEWDESSGKPMNLQTLLEALLEARPYLKGQTKPVVPAIGATNAATTGRTDATGGALTLDQIKQMSPAEQEKRADEVNAFLKTYRAAKK